MLYHLIQTKGGVDTVYMTDERPKVLDRMKQLRTSHRKDKITYRIEPAGENDVKYRKPPIMGFDPSGDVLGGPQRTTGRAAKLGLVELVDGRQMQHPYHSELTESDVETMLRVAKDKNAPSGRYRRKKP